MRCRVTSFERKSYPRSQAPHLNRASRRFAGDEFCRRSFFRRATLVTAAALATFLPLGCTETSSSSGSGGGGGGGTGVKITDADNKVDQIFNQSNLHPLVLSAMLDWTGTPDIPGKGINGDGMTNAWLRYTSGVKEVLDGSTLTGTQKNQQRGWAESMYTSTMGVLFDRAEDRLGPNLGVPWFTIPPITGGFPLQGVWEKAVDFNIKARELEQALDPDPATFTKWSSVTQVNQVNSMLMIGADNFGQDLVPFPQ